MAEMRNPVLHYQNSCFRGDWAAPVDLTRRNVS